MCDLPCGPLKWFQTFTRMSLWYLESTKRKANRITKEIERQKKKKKKEDAPVCSFHSLTK